MQILVPGDRTILDERVTEQKYRFYYPLNTNKPTKTELAEPIFWKLSLEGQD